MLLCVLNLGGTLQMANDNSTRTTTSTQIRNFYSDGRSYLNISFYNTLLSFRFYPFLNKDNVGKSSYDMKKGQSTTVNFEGAFALYQASKDIIENKIQEINLTLSCPFSASLIFTRKMNQQGKYETHFSINKNGATIDFVFDTTTTQVTVNGKQELKVIESGLGAFMKTIEGYLTGINAERHLNKLTDDYVKNIEQQGQQNQQRTGYQQNQGYKKSYNGYRKPYGQNNNWKNNNQNRAPQQTQGFSDYQLPN